MAQTTPDASFGPVLVAAAQTNPSHPFETSIEPLLLSFHRRRRRPVAAWLLWLRGCRKLNV